MNDLTQPKVLIVDDDTFYLALETRLIVQIFPRAEVVTVDSHERAIETLKKGIETDTHFNLVISDLDLKSKSSGIDLWTYCRANAPFTEFLLISGLPMQEFMAMVGDATEVPAYLPKPFRPAQCRDLIYSILTGKMSHVA